MQLNLKKKFLTLKKIIKFNFINLIRIFLRISNIYFIYLSTKNPLTSKPEKTKEFFYDLASKASKKIYEEVDIYETENNFKLNKDWIDELALTTQVTVKHNEICYAHGRILYSALRNRISKLDIYTNISVFETGTARGFSSICMAKALKDSNIIGKIITIDQLPHNKAIYWNSISDHTQGKITRQELLNKWKNITDKYIIFLTGDSRVLINSLNFNRVHFAFLDGCHTYNDVHFEFSLIKYKQKSKDIIIFDDYTNKIYNGVVRAVDEICNEFRYTKKLIRLNEKRYLLVATKL